VKGQRSRRGPLAARLGPLTPVTAAACSPCARSTERCTPLRRPDASSSTRTGRLAWPARALEREELAAPCCSRPRPAACGAVGRGGRAGVGDCSAQSSARVQYEARSRAVQILYGLTRQPVHLDAAGARAPSKHAPAQIPYEEVQKHTSRESCWVIVEGQVCCYVLFFITR
jgi:cytochrome b involved in lipid metabolism